MEILALPALTPELAPDRCVVALGFFDGVHTAHAAVLLRARQEAEARSLPLLVFTFLLSDGPKADPRLGEEEERAALLAAHGAAYLSRASFSALSSLSPAVFVREVLREELHAEATVVGEDFRFGHRAVGDAPLLALLMREAGGDAVTVPSVSFEGERVSSSRIRAALLRGDCEGAGYLLGRPYALTLPVQRGRHLGHALGFPTANQLPPEGRMLPAAGVYVTSVLLPDGRRMRGVTDVGTRPTVGGEELRMETHIPGFSGDLYGQPLTVAFLHRLREERRFSSLSALAEQIAKDCKEVLLWSIPNGHN